MDKILKFFVKDKLIVNLMIIIIVAFGLVQVKNAKREVFPDVESDMMIVRIVYPGASAEDVELNALIPVENVIKNINGIDNYVSMTMDGGASISLELDSDVSDKQAVKDEIYRSVSLSSISDVSDDVTKITVTEMNPKMISVMKLALVPKDSTTSESELYAMADILENLFEKISDVSSVTKSGYRDRKIFVEVDPRKLESNYISISDVVSSIKNRNVRSSSGTIQSIEREENIITIGEFRNPVEVGDVIIRSGFEQKSTLVKDIAKIIDGFEEVDTKTVVDGKPTVILSIAKKENSDIIKTVEAIKSYMEENKDVYQDKFELSILQDSSISIESLLGVVISNALIGFLLVILVLKLFLDFKTSFWTAFSIPLCLLMVLGYMTLTGLSINMITLGAFITVLGMLVDDAIVIAETIYAKKESGMAPLEAAITGIKEVIGPVIVTVLSTIIAFLPMMFITGRMGSFIYVFPVVITVALLASLFESVTMLPNHLANGKHKSVHKEKKWFVKLQAGYQSVLRVSLKKRYFVLAGFAVLLVFSVFLSVSRMRGFTLMNSTTSEQFYAILKAENGTTLQRTEKITYDVEQDIRKYIREGELVSVISTIGKDTTARNGEAYENYATVEVRLTPSTSRSRSTKEIISEIRKNVATGSYKGLEDLVLKESRMGPVSGSAIDIKVVGNNEQKSLEVVQLLSDTLSGIKGVKDVSNDLAEGKEELQIRFNYKKLAEYGLTVNTVASTVRTAFEGTEATYVQTAESKISFYVQIDDKYRKDTTFLMNLLIPNTSGKLIRLKEIAYVEKSKAMTAIRHKDGERSISVTADVDPKITTSNNVNLLVKEKMKNISTEYPGIYLIYEGEFKQTQEALGDLGIAMIAAIVMIYIVILLLFRSPGIPLIIMAVIPFGLIGVLLAFAAHGVSLDFMAMIGIIGLSGVVVNDSIIMVDFINKLRKKYPDGNIIDRIVEGAGQRLRPIILTTVTTVAGLMPSVYGIGGDVEAFRTTVMAMAYGLLFATLLTLIFIPSLYLVAYDFKSLFKRKSA